MANEGVIIAIILMVIILGIFLLYKAGIFRRHVTVTIIENLPPWIFKKGRREDYSKNCELKSSKNEDGESENAAEEHIKNDDSYEKCEDESETDDQCSSLEKESSNHIDDLGEENLNEELKDDSVMDESFEADLDNSEVECCKQSFAESRLPNERVSSNDEIEDLVENEISYDETTDESVVCKVSNYEKNDDSAEIKNSEYEEENDSLDSKVSDVPEHKPKFITNSLSMLKDYEKLLDKLNDDSVEESNHTATEEENNMFEDNSQSQNIENLLPLQENCKVKQEEKEEPKCEEVVYWTTAGKTYHKKKTCTALARSKVIHNGTIAESGKLSACSKCK